MLVARRIKFAFSILTILTLTLGYLVVRHSYIEHALLPAPESVYPWRAHAGTDAGQGGSSAIDLRDSTYSLSFDFTLSAEPQYPYATVALIFHNDARPDNLENWSQYTSVRLRVKCRPDNLLSFLLHTHDDQVSAFADISTFRPSLAFFKCSEEWQTLRLDLQRLDTQEWWLRKHNLNLAERDYRLDKVRGFSLVSSPQSPTAIPASVTLEEITLEGRRWQLIYLAILWGIAVWGGFFYWCIPRVILLRNNARAAQTLTPLGISPVNYQPVSVDSKYEREKSAVLAYLAAAYVNPNLSVDTAVKALGINRTKINDILKEEAGLTFSTYLNKMRLTEAARLLSDKQMGVAEAAFAVGYSSLSYFNRVFKKAYGCTPSAYRSPATAGDSDPAL